jgi:hypothetical protein
MSRSKHTDPKRIRALRRIRGPRDKRNVGDLSLRRKIGLRRKNFGAELALQRSDPRGQPRLRIVVHSPGTGFHHPADKGELLELLNSIGTIGQYGLRCVELARSPATATTPIPMLVFGRYCAPGQIILFEQRLPPWRIPGMLKGGLVRRFQRAGAIVKLLADVNATLVDWPGNTLRRFMVEDVFLHELGHHVLQHYKGKRSVRIARTRDHEAFALRFVKKHSSIVKGNGIEN